MDKKRLWLLIAAIILVACGTQAQPTPAPVESTEDLIEALQTAGAEIRTEEERGEVLDGVLPTSLSVRARPFWIYEFPDSETSHRVADALKGGGAGFGRLGSAAAESPQFWSHGKLLVIYEGTDGGTILLISGLIGDAFTRPAVSIDEPYPPSIPAAIRFLSGQVGVDPALVEVLSYSEDTFPDTCLGIPRPGEACPETDTPGWIIKFIVEGEEYEVHTDMLGTDVRWFSE